MVAKLKLPSQVIQLLNIVGMVTEKVLGEFQAVVFLRSLQTLPLSCHVVLHIHVYWRVLLCIYAVMSCAALYSTTAMLHDCVVSIGTGTSYGRETKAVRSRERVSSCQSTVSAHLQWTVHPAVCIIMMFVTCTLYMMVYFHLLYPLITCMCTKQNVHIPFV